MGLLLSGFFVGVPVAFGLLIAALIIVGLDPLLSLKLVGTRMVNAVNSYPLLSIPLFILTGEVMNRCEITDRIFKFAESLVGHIRGTLAHVNVFASLVFSGMSGSAVADVAGLGRMEIKAMTDAGMSKGFSAVVTAASSTIGPLVPPSIPLVIYGVIAQESVGRLLMAGVLPGIAVAVALSAMAYVIALRRGYRSRPFPGLKAMLASFLVAIPPLVTPVLLISGMFSGTFSPTEASAVAAGYALLLGIFVYRRLGLRDLKEIFIKVAVDSAAILFIIAVASLVGLIITRLHVAQALLEVLSGVAQSPLVVLFILNLLLLAVGCLLDATSALVLLTPLLSPVVHAFGIDPVHFGLVMVFNLMIGLITPPMGLSMLICADIAGINISTFVREAVPFYVVLVVVLLLLTYVPSISLWLPDLAFGV